MRDEIPTSHSSSSRLHPEIDDWSLLRLLKAQGIEMVQTIDEVVVEGLVHHDGTAQEILKLAAGTVVVPLDQPQGRLARTLLEPHASAGEAYFYDVAAWSLPMAFGVETLIASQPISGILIPLGPIEDPVGRVEQQAGVAYLHRWEGVPSARALRAIQKGGERGRLDHRGDPDPGSELSGGNPGRESFLTRHSCSGRASRASHGNGVPRHRERLDRPGSRPRFRHLPRTGPRSDRGAGPRFSLESFLRCGLEFSRTGDGHRVHDRFRRSALSSSRSHRCAGDSLGYEGVVTGGPHKKETGAVGWKRRRRAGAG